MFQVYEQEILVNMSISSGSLDHCAGAYYVYYVKYVCIGFNIRVFITPSVSSLFLLNITVIYHKIPNNHIVTVFNYMVIRLC